jgi:hypothetical protein
VEAACAAEAPALGPKAADAVVFHRPAEWCAESGALDAAVARGTHQAELRTLCDTFQAPWAFVCQ